MACEYRGGGSFAARWRLTQRIVCSSVATTRSTDRSRFHGDDSLDGSLGGMVVDLMSW